MLLILFLRTLSAYIRLQVMLSKCKLFHSFQCVFLGRRGAGSRGFRGEKICMILRSYIRLSFWKNFTKCYTAVASQLISQQPSRAEQPCCKGAERCSFALANLSFFKKLSQHSRIAAPSFSDRHKVWLDLKWFHKSQCKGRVFVAAVLWNLCVLYRLFWVCSHARVSILLALVV